MQTNVKSDEPKWSKQCNMLYYLCKRDESNLFNHQI